MLTIKQKIQYIYKTILAKKVEDLPSYQAGHSAASDKYFLPMIQAQLELKKQPSRNIDGFKMIIDMKCNAFKEGLMQAIDTEFKQTEKE